MQARRHIGSTDGLVTYHFLSHCDDGTIMLYITSPRQQVYIIIYMATPCCHTMDCAGIIMLYITSSPRQQENIFMATPPVAIPWTVLCSVHM